MKIEKKTHRHLRRDLFARDKIRAVIADIVVECLLAGGDDAMLHHVGRELGAGDDGPLILRHQLLIGNRKPGAAELLTHPTVPQVARVGKFPDPPLEILRLVIEAVAEDMNILSAVFSAEFDPGHHIDALPEAGMHRLCQSRRRVMIRERECRQPEFFCVMHELCRGECPVGAVGVHM